MGRMTYTDGRTALTTTAFRYKLTDTAGTLVKDWTTGATWTEEPAGTYYLDDADAVAGTVYAVEPASGEVGGVGQVDWGKPAATGDAMTLTAAYDAAKGSVQSTVWTDAKAGYLTGNVALAASLSDAITGIAAIPTTPLLAASYTAPDNASIAAILEDTGTTIPQKIAVVNTVVDGIDTRTTSMATNTNAIKTKTDNLPSDTSAVLSTIDGIVDDILVDTGTTLPATLSSISGKVDAVDDLVDTEVAAIKTVVDAIAVHAARIYRYFFNKTLHTNTAVVIYADDGVTADAVMAVSGDSASVTKGAAS